MHSFHKVPEMNVHKKYLYICLVALSLHLKRCQQMLVFDVYMKS